VCVGGAFAASGYRVNAGLDVLQAVVGLLVRLQCVLAPPTHTVTSLVNQPQLEARPTRQSHGNQRLQRQLEGAPDDGHNSAGNMLSGVYATKQ
jgi:hypothetical protein